MNPTSDGAIPYLQSRVKTDGAVFYVHRQPISLDRLTVHDVRPDIEGINTPFLLPNQEF